MELYLFFSYMPLWYAQADFILFYIDIFGRGPDINCVKRVLHQGRFSINTGLIELHKL
jgi:hypothetical protein